MKHGISCLGLLFVAACGGATVKPVAAPPPPAVFQRDPGAEMSAQDALTAMMAALDSGDIATLKTLIAPEVLASYDVDPNNLPIKLNSHDEVVGYLEKMLSIIKGMGGTVRSSITDVSCHATGTLAVCTTEIEQAFTAQGQSSSMPFRASMALRKGPDGWKFTHWHASLAKAPEPPPPPPAPPTLPPFDTKTFDAKTLPWMAPPGAPPGFKVAVVWGDPTQGPFAAFVEMPKGTVMPRHYHDQGTSAYVIKGGIKITLADGRVVDGKPGAWMSMPGKVIHTTEAKGGLLALQYCDGPEKTVFVDDQGKPLAGPPGPAAAGK